MARTLNSAIEVIVRRHSEQEAQLLESERVGKVFMGEYELAKAMAAYVLTRAGGSGRGAHAQTDSLR